MQQHIGEEFNGVISATAEFGLFVTLKDLYVDGMVHVSQLGNDYFTFDQASQSLVGQNHGQTFSLGDEVKIKVAGVNLGDRKIDFELVQQLTHAGRAIRSRAPRVAKATSPEQVFSPSAPSKPRAAKPASSNASDSGEKPVRKKKATDKPSTAVKKPRKKAAAKPDTKVKDKEKKKLKKKKSNAKNTLD